MFQVNYNGEVWRYAYVEPDGCLTESDREKVLWNAIDLHKNSKKSRKIKGEQFEGLLEKTGRTGRFGAFYGASIRGVLETDKGKRNIEILLQEANPALLN